MVDDGESLVLDQWTLKMLKMLIRQALRTNNLELLQSSWYSEQNRRSQECHMHILWVQISLSLVAVHHEH